MPGPTRRELIAATGSAAVAAAVLGPRALAAAGSTSASRDSVAAGSRGVVAPPRAPYSNYQAEIFLAGTRGVTPRVTTNLTNLEAHAAQVLSAEARSYLLADAGGRRTARANARAFRNWRIVPRMFRDHAVRDLSTTVLGAWMPAPVILAPVGRQTLAHPEGELASARAAAELELAYVHSSDAARPPEEVAGGAGAGSRWYELAWRRGEGPDLSLLERARAAAYTHLVLTPPTPRTDRRRLAAIRAEWDGPILLRGVQTPEQTKRAIGHGLDGIVVSNHRARKGEEANGSLDTLRPIIRAAGGRLDVLFDSGVRTGPDAFKALALGADAVLIGRPYVYGLALDGQAGVTHVLRTLLAELDLSLANAGYTTHLDLDPSSLSAVHRAGHQAHGA
jgi:lactate 2-monooxygenase